MDVTSENEVVRPPPLLAAILDLTSQTERIDEDIFSEFLRLAQARQEQCQLSRIHISCSSKYTTRSQEIQSSPHDKVVTSAQNGSLSMIFEYYAKLEPPNTLQATTFSEVSMVNDTMSMLEFMIFLRDFRVIPRLLTKREVREVWSTIAIDWVTAGKGAFKKMDFPSFKDAIVRLAVSAFCKPGLRNLMKKVNGFVMTSRHAIDYFTKYLHLEDERWVKTHINIVGKESQGARNYRSKGEVDERAIADNKEDREKNRLIIRTHLHRKKRRMYLRPPTNISKSERTPQIPPTDSLLPEHLRMALYPEFYEQPKAAAGANSDLDAVEEGFEDEDYNEELEVDPNNTASGGETQQLSMPEVDTIQKVVRDYYDHSLVKTINRFCVEQDGRANTRHIFSEGPFLDMGVLPVGAHCKVRLAVTNKSSDHLLFDISVRSLECFNVQVLTKATMLIPGLCRNIDILFTVTPGDRSVIGFVDFHYLCEKSVVSTMISCPIYYQVGINNPNQDRSICTIHTIASLTRQVFTSRDSRSSGGSRRGGATGVAGGGGSGSSGTIRQSHEQCLMSARTNKYPPLQSMAGSAAIGLRAAIKGSSPTHKASNNNSSNINNSSSSNSNIRHQPIYSSSLVAAADAAGIDAGKVRKEE